MLTPWGRSETLRERRLMPRRGTEPEEVARNQRERLFAATVAAVAAKGYEETTVADLLELSGVSRASFYEHFADKEQCFLATLEALTEPAVALVGAAAAKADDGERVRVGLETFLALLGAQRAAAHVCFVEIHCAGPTAVAVVEAAFEAFAEVVAASLDRYPGRAGLPSALVRAITGGVWQVIHRRLCHGESEDLAQLAGDLRAWGLSYPPPPEPLRPSRRMPPPPRDGTAYEEGERILRAFTATVCELGYPKTTVSQAAERASCSLSTFYSHFPDKEAAMVAAIDAGASQMLAAIRPAYRRGGDWPRSVCLALRALLAFGPAEPLFSQLGTVEVLAAGRRALAQRDEILVGVEELLAPGFDVAPDVPAIATEAIAGAVSVLLYDQVRKVGPHRLPELAPLVCYLALCPFLGPEEACREANRKR